MTTKIVFHPTLDGVSREVSERDVPRWVASGWVPVDAAVTKLYAHGREDPVAVVYDDDREDKGSE